MKIYGAAGFSHPADQCMSEHRETPAAMESGKAKNRKKNIKCRKISKYRKNTFFGGIFKIHLIIPPIDKIK